MSQYGDGPMSEQDAASVISRAFRNEPELIARLAKIYAAKQWGALALVAIKIFGALTGNQVDLVASVSLDEATSIGLETLMEAGSATNLKASLISAAAK